MTPNHEAYWHAPVTMSGDVYFAVSLRRIERAPTSATSSGRPLGDASTETGDLRPRLFSRVRCGAEAPGRPYRAFSPSRRVSTRAPRPPAPADPDVEHDGEPPAHLQEVVADVLELPPGEEPGRRGREPLLRRHVEPARPQPRAVRHRREVQRLLEPQRVGTPSPLAFAPTPRPQEPPTPRDSQGAPCHPGPFPVVTGVRVW